MTGRGGFKSTTSLRPEQLQGMGITGKDMPSSTITPPPIFPPLPSRPAPLEKNAERDFMISWKEHFISYLKMSPYYTETTGQAKRSHSRFYFESSQVDGGSAAYTWSLMPSELRPNWKRKLPTKDGRNKVAKIVNVEETLKALEEKEVNRKRAEIKEEVKEEDKESENENENAEGEEQDDEMDEDNDYGFSYFDNGDDYNEEDDNLDDGPVY